MSIGGSDKPHNKKVPKDAYNVDDAQTFYADNYWTYRSCPGGTHHIEYRAPDKKYNHDMENYPDGSFYHTNQNGGGSKDEYTANFTNRNKRSYTSWGDSDHTDGHGEELNMQTHNHGCGGERSVTTACNYTQGSTGKNVSAGSDFAHITKGSNDCTTSGEACSIDTTTSDQQSDHCSGDNCKTAGEINYKVFGDDAGSYGMKNVSHMAKDSYQVIGNKNIYLDCGQGSANIHLEDKKITLKVGGSSITIEDGKITLKASKIILDGETHCGGAGGQPAGKCGGGCANRTFVT